MIQLACASDAKFYPFAATMLCSAFAHTTDELEIYLLCEGIPEAVLNEFQSWARARGHRLHPLPLDTSSLAAMRVDQHVSLATYYRLLLPAVLPRAVERVIYLDCDLIVRRSLRDLWEQETSAKGLAAVRDFHHDRPNETRWNFPADHTYFNAGVLLIDLAAWREGNVAQAVIDRVAREPEKMMLWDQDGLNLEFAGAWRELPLEWNVQQHVFTDPRLSARFADLARDPAIVHFTGGIKPWYRGVAHPFAEEFWRYHASNPFKDHYRLSPLGWRDRLRSLKRRAGRLYQAAVPKVAAFDHLWQTRPLREMTRLADARRHRLEQEARLAREAANREALRALLPDLIVPGGPFKGLRYDPSTLPDHLCGPKVLGCYEAEINSEIATWLGEPWDFVLNVGCGDGYHAVGFARFQAALVIAYDPDPQARAACERLARVNGVEGKLEVRPTFSLRELPRYASTPGRGLLVCNCGGAEKHLFHPSVPGMARLAACDLVIELHEAAEPGVGAYLHELFAPTHAARFVPTVDDLIRPRVFPCPTLQALSHGQQVQLQAEHRPRAMEWLVLRAKGTPNLPR